jgi:hypothetical protein
MGNFISLVANIEPLEEVLGEIGFFEHTEFIDLEAGELVSEVYNS